MRKVLSFLLLLVMVSCSFRGAAQSLRKKFSAGFGIESGIPGGDVKDLYGYSAGLTLRFAYRAGAHGFVTLTSGPIVYGSKELASVNLKVGVQLPVKAGYKYIFGRHFFVMGELGYSVFRAYADDANGIRQHTQSGGFTYAPGGGVQFGVLEIGIRYESFRTNDVTIRNAALRLGFNF